MRIISLQAFVSVLIILDVTGGKGKGSLKNGGKSKQSSMAYKYDIDQRDLLSNVVSEQASLLGVMSKICSSVRAWTPRKKKVDDIAAYMFFTTSFCSLENAMMYHQDWLSSISLTKQEVQKGVSETQNLSGLVRTSGNLYKIVAETQEIVNKVTGEYKTIREIRSKVEGLASIISKFLHDMERHRAIWVTMTRKAGDLNFAILEYSNKRKERLELGLMSAEDVVVVVPETATTTSPMEPETTIGLMSAEDVVVVGPTAATTTTTVEPETTISRTTLSTSSATTSKKFTTKRMSWADMVDSADEDEYDDDEEEEGQIFGTDSAERLKEVFEDETSTTTTMEPMADWKVVNSRKNRKNDRKY